MAFGKALSGNPYVNGAAVGFAPPEHSGQSVVLQGTRTETPDVGTLGTRLAAKFIHGGSTAWERPGSDIAP